MVSLLNAARDIGRIREISTVLVRHGFGEVVSRLGWSKVRKDADASESPTSSSSSAATRVRRVLEDLGPSFVKLGQIASTRADLLPPDVIAELKKLQDNVPPVSFEAIKARVEQSLGATLEELFSSFDPKPLAAASIAQVHRAVLRTAQGEREVVVKVQRPGIGETVASDLDLLHTFVALLERTVPESRIYSPTGLVQQFDRAITSELDFSTEAENAGRFARNARDFPQARFPRVYREASGKHVITLEYLDGVKIYEAVQRGHDPKKLARLAIDIVIRQIFEDGFFHADPHPGNVLVLGTPEEPIFALVDLGMVGRLSPRMRDLTVDLMIAAVRHDYEGIADALYEIGNPTRKIDQNAFRAEVAVLTDRYLGKQLKDIEMSSLVRDLIRAGTQYGIEIPSDFVLVGKTLMTIEGIGKEIAPDLDVFEECKPFFLEILKKRYSPERLGPDLLRRFERLSGASQRVPEALSEVLDDLRRGRLTIRSEDLRAELSSDRLGRRLYSAIVAAALLLGGSWLLATGQQGIGQLMLGIAFAVLTLHLARDVYRSLRRP
ncbi:MAG TPA: AarF/ABC1/UbiB kinase family protein [Polyangiaceae bacterium]|nr:AarF/ABC1/UbiB kinase family protein [Polyangiaceae bacterium]